MTSDLCPSQSAGRLPTLARRALVVLIAASLATLPTIGAKAADPRIMCVGDSITAGYTDNPTWNVPFQFGYRSGLYTRLVNAGYSFSFVGASPEPWDGKWGVPQNEPSPDLRVLGSDKHRGYGGAGIALLRENISGWVTQDNPDLMLLMIGINDIAAGSSGHPVAVESSLNDLVGTIFGTSPNVRLIVAQIAPYSTFTDSIVQYNDYIKNTLVPAHANMGRHIITVDQYSNFLTPSGMIDAGLHSNGINHPSMVGYDRMAETWFSGIQRITVHTPEPRTLTLLGSGLFGLGAHAWRKRKLCRAGGLNGTIVQRGRRQRRGDCL